MSKKTIKFKIMQLQILNPGKIVVGRAMDQTSYYLETNMYYGDIKLPKNIKMVFRTEDSYNGKIFFKLRDTNTDEYLAFLVCSSKKDLHKGTNRNTILNKFIELNYPNVKILQKDSLSFVLDSKIDIEQINVPEGVTIKIDLYAPNNEVQCKILDINGKQIGVLNCLSLKKENKTK